ncbi:MAG: hypothetical protein HDR53_07225 [Treponema sp.]|nr:hypothetical protein [Treponema sp.]
MKKLLSFFIAGVLAVGLAGCSGDLHDNNDAPIVERPTLIVGAMNYDGGNVFSEMVKVDELTSSYTFIYKSSMSSNWGSPADGVAFKVGYEIDGWDQCWSQEEAGTAQLSDGAAETVCKAQNANNIAFGGLADGKTYKITVVAGIASVSVKIEQAADIPAYILNANGKLYAMDYSADGEKDVYKAAVTPTNENLELIFFDGTDNYGSKTPAIDVSGNDTDKDGNAMASKLTVIDKLSDTVTDGVQYTGLKKNASNKIFEYIVTLTVDGETKTVAITRVIPKIEVVFEITASGLKKDDYVYVNGSPWGWGGDWPFTAWNGNDATKTEACLKLTDKFAKADDKGNAKFGNLKLTLPDNVAVAGWEIKMVDIIGDNQTSYTPGTINYDNGTINTFIPKKGYKYLININNTGSAYTVSIAEEEIKTVELQNIIVNTDLTGYTLIGDFNDWGGDVEGVVANGKTTYDVSTYTSDTLGQFKFRHNKAWDDPQIGGSDGNISLPDSDKAGKANVIIDVDMNTLLVTKIEYSYID